MYQYYNKLNTTCEVHHLAFHTCLFPRFPVLNFEKDLSALSVCLHMAWRRAQDREQWQRTVEAAMLQHGACP